MSRLFSGLASAVLATACVAAQGRGDSTPATGAATAAADPAFYAVSYVETRPAARDAAIAAFSDYRRASRPLGAATVELFEQTGRPGHWLLIEKWTAQATFDGRSAGPQKQLLDALAPIRVSGYDLRPYKPLSVGAGS